MFESVKPNRRTFLVASTLGALSRSIDSTHAAGDTPSATRPKAAKSTILFFLCGGASHIDTWDMKPDAPAEYRGPFGQIRSTASDIPLCEHLPMTAKQAHLMTVVHGVTDRGQTTGDHHAGYYYNLTGRVPDLTFRTQGNDRRPYPSDYPFMGSVVGSSLPSHPSLPQVITLPHKPSRPPYTRPGQFSARLGIEHDPLYLDGYHKNPTLFQAPSLVLDGSMTQGRMADRRSLLRSLDSARRDFEHTLSVSNLQRQHEKAFSLLASASTTGAFDLTDEPLSVRERYGETINGMSLLMARRLVEAGVPFITVFWKEDDALRSKCRSAGGWDTHGNNFNCLAENLLPEFDRGYSALLEDLSSRGLLDDTLVMVSSEMGRRPMIGDRRSGGVTGAGRDHWTACMSVLFAGGGMQGGLAYGQSDRHAEYPEDNPIGPEDITRSVYHAMGIDERQAQDPQGVPFNLLGEGRPLLELF